MPSETDLYFPITDARYEQSFIAGVTFTPILSLWGHTAGAASNPADLAFLAATASAVQAHAREVVVVGPVPQYASALPRLLVHASESDDPYSTSRRSG